MKPFIALITLACTFIPRTVSSFLPPSLYGGIGGGSPWDSGAISQWGGMSDGGLNPYGAGISQIGGGISPFGAGISQFGGGISPFGAGVSQFGGGISPFGSPSLGESGALLGGGFGSGGINPWGAQNQLGLGGYESSPFSQLGGLGGMGGMGGIGGVNPLGLSEGGVFGGQGVGVGPWGSPAGLSHYGSSVYQSPLVGGGSYGFGPSVPQQLGGLGQMGFGSGGLYSSGVDPSGLQLGGSSLSSPLISSFRSSVIAKRSAE